jgi:hypothetical protein
MWDAHGQSTNLDGEDEGHPSIHPPKLAVEELDVAEEDSGDQLDHELPLVQAHTHDYEVDN